MNETRACRNLWPMEFIADWTLNTATTPRCGAGRKGWALRQYWTETEKTDRVRLLFIRKP